ncbi:MAG: leucyl/phenylalanyl-tRNA--protein transferase [Sphingobacteriales bacterium]|nr:leucyl/phenylalanyl-tRNA--protein transferase [Sphingobacteriales bacterium]
MFYQLDNELWFPNPELAEEDGLLAVGGDLTIERLLLAYNNGIFPWYSDETPILWYSPHQRFVIFPEKVKVAKSMAKVMKGGGFQFTFNRNFKEVIENCATINRGDEEVGTWITAEMKQAYVDLHTTGFAHSVEVWQGESLVGGLYGVVINSVFCGESMFSKASNASKAALIHLCTNGNFKLIDCQLHNDHLESMGGEFISRKNYIKILHSKDLIKK